MTDDPTAGPPRPETLGKANPARRGRWNPYAVGVGIGVLSWAVFAVVDKPLGISGGLTAISGACATPVLGSETVAENPYWAKYPFQWDYRILFLIGTFLGSLISVTASRSFRLETVPSVWFRRFGGSKVSRLTVAFFGGVAIMFGARLAGGCTSGHGISGSLQLAVSSCIAAGSRTTTSSSTNSA